jgi:hypothetical protein
MIKKIILLNLILLTPHRGYNLEQQFMIVNVPVADLRAQPVANDRYVKLPASDLDNPLQITQLLLGEHVLIVDEYINQNQELWYKVATLQQSCFYPEY